MRNKARRSPARNARGGAHRGGGRCASALWIYGRHPVCAALTNPARRFHRLLLTREAEAGLGDGLPGSTPGREIVSAREITALLPEGAVHQGYAALAEPLPAVALDHVLGRLADAPKACLLVLDQVTDPRNTGAILRSAAALGAAAVIVPDRRSPSETAALAKAASGALEAVDLVRVTNIARALETLKGAGFWCIGLDAAAPVPLGETDLSGRIALVMGSEGRGLRRLVAKGCDGLAALPMSGPMESLNVSAAAAIALYEAARQREARSPTPKPG
ncbi:MAG: 23S rRNA (guanosine(2251)-2'-O)-methyltransferase RlmB [Alphaproteobacteria bacterium]|nr:23S rRNA (guanosine(2251)-2'-O)-methyltransferase RlmB [Alphaproteobacteria bacterium]